MAFGEPATVQEAAAWLAVVAAVVVELSAASASTSAATTAAASLVVDIVASVDSDTVVVPAVSDVGYEEYQDLTEGD